MEQYGQWVMKGKFSSRPNAFGFGQTFMTAWMKYRKTGDPFAGSLNPKRPGNGCIMRLAPVPLFFFPDEDRTVHYSGESSKTTHGMEESVQASRLFGRMLFLALSGKSRDEILFGHPDIPESPEIVKQIARGDYRDKREDEIESTFFAGKCLEAALWCFYRTDCFRDAILKAANLGGDADSTAAVCGQIAGAHYGFDAIPGTWVNSLKNRNAILDMARRLFQSA
jgi:ADP-ribosyl-[dinitrogen reductase] hydrolase